MSKTHSLQITKDFLEKLRPFCRATVFGGVCRGWLANREMEWYV
jgi:hypothetical protein